MLVTLVWLKMKQKLQYEIFKDYKIGEAWYGDFMRLGASKSIATLLCILVKNEWDGRFMMKAFVTRISRFRVLEKS